MTGSQWVVVALGGLGVGLGLGVLAWACCVGAAEAEDAR